MKMSFFLPKPMYDLIFDIENSNQNENDFFDSQNHISQNDFQEFENLT